MAAAVVSRPDLVLHFGADAVLVASASGVSRVPDESIGAAFDCIDDERMTIGGQLLRTVDVIAAAVHQAVRTATGGTGFVREVVVLHPSYWGAARRSVLESAARRSGREVTLLPVALGVPLPDSGTRRVILECGPLSTCATLVERDPHGLPTVVACELDSETGALDIRAHPQRVTDLESLVRRLTGGDRVEVVHVTDTEGDVECALADGLGCAVAAVPERDLVRHCLRASAVEVSSGQVARDADLEPDRAAPWFEDAPGTAPAREGRTAPAAAAAVLVTAAVVGGLGFWMWTKQENPTVGTEVSLRPFVIGAVRGEVPVGWHTQQPGPLRLELEPGSESGRRIVVTSQEVAGFDRAAVARDLARLMAERGADSPFSRFDPEAEFAGRSGISYVESPDDRSEVRWHVFVEGGVQVSVGCQFREEDWVVLAADCEQVVRSLTVETG